MNIYVIKLAKGGFFYFMLQRPEETPWVHNTEEILTLTIQKLHKLYFENNPTL